MTAPGAARPGMTANLRGMALMTAATIVFAILADFLLLPPILMAIDGKEQKHA